MLNIDEINNTIEELENGVTTFDTCIKLASLYIVKEHYKNAENTLETSNSDKVEHELSDILPQYHRYVELKAKYQLGEISPTAIESSIQSVCKEISEFLHTLYNCTDMQMERDCIMAMIQNLNLK